MAIGAAVLGQANGLVLAMAIGPVAFALAVIGLTYMIAEVFRGFGADFKFAIAASYALVGLSAAPFIGRISEFSNSNSPLATNLELVIAFLTIAWFAALGYAAWHIYRHFAPKKKSEDNSSVPEPTNEQTSRNQKKASKKNNDPPPKQTNQQTPKAQNPSLATSPKQTKDSFDKLYSDIKGIGYTDDTANRLISLIEDVRKGTYTMAELLSNLKQSGTGNDITNNVMRRLRKLLFNNNKEEMELYVRLVSHQDGFLHAFSVSLDKRPSSGWKLHIYGESIIDAAKIWRILGSHLEKLGVSYKVGTTKILDYRIRGSEMFGGHQYGKAFVIYIPMIYFQSGPMTDNKKAVHFIDGINKLLKDNGYSKKGKIMGDEHYKGSIHYRYEMSIPMRREGFNKKLYFPPDGYYKEAEGTDGSYNDVPDNPDLFSKELSKGMVLKE